MEQYTEAMPIFGEIDRSSLDDYVNGWKTIME
jgi:hypothetical protein|nr:MAG TPA: hypothetical protein [Caudoviricetes sp.]